jgi:hypothetical protein
MRTPRLLTLGTILLVLGATTALQGQTVLIDDFEEDGNLDGWTTLDFSAGQPWGPGEFVVSGGELRMAYTGSEPAPADIPSIVQSTLFAFWDDSTDPMYSNGILQAKMRTDELENSTSIHMRGDLGTFSTYLTFGNTRSVRPGSSPLPPYYIGLATIVGGVETDLWESDFDYLPGVDWNVQLGVIGDEISVKAWEVGAEEPDLPLVTFYDSSLTQGQIILTSDVSGGRVLPGQADGSFDDIYFTFVPEPGAIAVDIKPGSDRNPINLKSKGVLPVAIVSTEDVFAPDIDVDEWLFGDPDLMNTGGIPVEPLRTSVEDVSGDGIMDLTLKFSVQELVENGVLGPDSLQGRLAGYVDGVPQFIGRDSIGLVPRSGAVPEPATVLLLLLGGMSLAIYRRG